MPQQKINKVQNEVLRGLLNGQSINDVGKELQLADVTIYLIVGSAIRTLGAKNIYDALRIYRSLAEAD